MVNNIRECLAYNIRYYRKKLHLSQQDFANILNSSTKQNISNWENNKNAPSIEDIAAMAELFNTTIDDLVYKKAHRPRKQKGLELLDFYAIPNKVFTFVLFFKDNCNTEFTAWIYDQDYPTIAEVAACCAKHNDYISFKNFIMNDIDKFIEQARDFMDSKCIDEYATQSRNAKNMIEFMEEIADNPPQILT